MTLNPRVILFAVAVLSISSMFIFSMPMSVCAESEYSEYVTPNGSVYEYAYGSGSSSDPYYSVIYGFISDSDNVMIQSALEGYEVTCIAENAFSGCSKLAYVIIPERIESIGNGAFSGCASLTDVYFLGDIPSEMGSDAFPDNTIFHYVEGMSGWDSYEGHDLEMMLSGSVRSSDGSYSEYSDSCTYRHQTSKNKHNESATQINYPWIISYQVLLQAVGLSHEIPDFIRSGSLVYIYDIFGAMMILPSFYDSCTSHCTNPNTYVALVCSVRYLRILSHNQNPLGHTSSYILRNMLRLQL